jgi:hypothetical protein
MMLPILEKYFLEHGQLVLPGIGQLSLNQKDAFALNDELQPPVEKIEFVPILDSNNKPSKLFYIYLSDHLDCTIEQAIIDYAAFFAAQIDKSNLVDLGNLGQLKSINDTFAFQSNFNSAKYYQTISLEKVLTQDQSENNFNTPSKQWWILPFIIAIIAIIAILLK